MGRVYDVKRNNFRARVVATNNFGEDRGVIRGVHRVEFDDDADAGLATVHAFLTTDPLPGPPPGGVLVLNATTRGRVDVIFRTWCRLDPVPAAPPDVEQKIAAGLRKSIDSLEGVNRAAQVAALVDAPPEAADAPHVVGG